MTARKGTSDKSVVKTRPAARASSNRWRNSKATASASRSACIATRWANGRAVRSVLHRSCFANCAMRAAWVKGRVLLFADGHTVPRIAPFVNRDASGMPMSTLILSDRAVPLRPRQSRSLDHMMSNLRSRELSSRGSDWRNGRSRRFDSMRAPSSRVCEALKTQER
jgi:hypothetical protein